MFEKKPSAPVGPPGKRNYAVIMYLEPPAKGPGDSSWIKKAEEVKQEQPKAPPVQPPKQAEPPKPIEQPRPVTQNPFQKSAAGEITSTKKVEETKAEPVVKPQEVVKSTPPAEEKKVTPADVQPKKLVVSDVFKQQPKQPEFPPKKAPVEPPRKSVTNPFEKKEEVVIQSSKPVVAE